MKKVLVTVSLGAVLFLILSHFGKLGNTVEYSSSGAAASVKNVGETKDRVKLLYDATTSTTTLPFADTSTTSTQKIEDTMVVVGTSTIPITVGPVKHIKTPTVVKAIYMTNCVASGSDLRERLVKLIERKDLNAVVIDVKDYTGYLSMDFGKGYPTGKKTCLVRDMKPFLAMLGEKGIYRIARVTVMQDPYYAETHPDQAVKRKDNGGVWKDKKGLAFVDPASQDFWKYIRDIGYNSYDSGFDEVNFDYVRYPTDGSLSNMAFKLNASTTKRMMMKNFFTYLGKSMKDRNIPSSVDIFGMTTTAKDDLGIGQYLEDVLPHFDYIAPMVYPSHYPKNFNNWKDPNMVTGPLTEFVMGKAVERAKAIGLPSTKLRTWVQDFDYGKDYTAADVRAIITASEKVGVKSYMVWDPGNKYTESAYNAKGTAKEIVAKPTTNDQN